MKAYPFINTEVIQRQVARVLPTLDWSVVKAYAKGYSWEDVFKNA